MFSADEELVRASLTLRASARRRSASFARGYAQPSNQTRRGAAAYQDGGSAKSGGNAHASLGPRAGSRRSRKCRGSGRRARGPVAVVGRVGAGGSGRQLRGRAPQRAPLGCIRGGRGVVAPQPQGTRTTQTRHEQCEPRERRSELPRACWRRRLLSICQTGIGGVRAL